MSLDRPRRSRFRLTIRQCGVLVAFFAVAFTALRSIVESSAGPWDFVLLASVELPYALLLPTVFLVYRGPIKGWIVAFLCAVPLFAFLIYFDSIAITGRIAPNLVLTELTLPLRILVAIANLMILGGLAYLSRWMIPRRCPSCGRFAMLFDPSVPRSRDFPGSKQARSCLACGRRFRRRKRGPWVDVASLPDRNSILA